MERHGIGIWNGPRKKPGARVDMNLYFAFKPVAIAHFGSVCRAFESFMLSLVMCDQALTEYGEERGTRGDIKIEMTNHIVRELSPRRKIEVGEILPIEHGLNDAVDRTYRYFSVLKHFPARVDVQKFVAGLGITGLDNQSVVEAVVKRIREDRKG